MKGLLYSPVKNYIISLTSLLQNDKTSINLVNESLLTRGYSFIRLPKELVEQIDICIQLMELFFQEPLYYKKKYFKEPIFGYFAVNHKESFRLLTGKRIDEQKIPDNLSQLKSLINTIDKIMYSMSLILAPTLFPNLLTNTHKLDIPLFDKTLPWGMFDIAKYHNTGSRTELNCKAHYDPGLLSLSLRSTQPGLQLKDEFGKWIKTPEDKNIAILWTGKAAHDLNNKIKLGVHRVVNPDTNSIGKPRISMWHEICTSAQEHKELINKKKPDSEAKTGIPISKSLSPSLLPSSASKELKKLQAEEFFGYSSFPVNLYSTL